MEEVAFRLEERLFPSIADVAVLSVDVNIEIVRIDAQCTTAVAACPGFGARSRSYAGIAPPSFLKVPLPEHHGLCRSRIGGVSGTT
ncbi:MULTISPECIES: hypothetical protein [unclassified Streptomyces]|uniref:hypothetical protein n=1 Tax=unclassified Streptomyces TaxID=2593676 RepID=UPI0032463E8C